MPPRRSAASITIRPLDDLFQPTVPQQQAEPQYPNTMQFHELHPFPDHPFQVRQDEELYKLADSIREHGLAEPILCRPNPDGNGYQIISGHRRAEACRFAGITDIPVSVREMDDDLTILVMVDANLHREKILPSEKAFSYKMKVEALDRRRSNTPGLVVSEYRRPTEIVGEEAGENYRNVMRYIRLTLLEKPLLDLVDIGKIKLHPAVELSYMKKREQALLLSFLENTCMKVIPSLQQARQLKAASQNSELTMDDFEDILIAKNVPEQSISFKLDDLREFFPSSYTVDQIKDGILDALANRQRNRERERQNMEANKNEYTSQERKPVVDEGLRDLLPALSDEAHEALTLDILENGCYSPIICMEDMTLVDGHNRYAICEENDIPYRMVVLPFEDKLAAKQWALDTQKARRNLTTWELGQIALKLKPEIEARAKANKESAIAQCNNSQGRGDTFSATLPKTLEQVDTRKELADAAGIGERTMGKIMKIEEEAPAPIKEAVESSDISINKGYQLTQKLRDIPEEEREAVAQYMLRKAEAEAEYRKGCDETDRQCDIANTFTAAFDKVAQLDPTKENICYWIDWCGIRPSHLESLILEAEIAVRKFSHIVETLTQATELGDWRNPCTILN